MRTSIFANKWNTFENSYSFRIAANLDTKTVDILSKIIGKKEVTVECSWTFAELENAFLKLKSLFFVTAEREKRGGNEYFHYTNATIFNKPTFNRLINLIEQGNVMVDIRLGVYSSGIKHGMAHDHGTAFRIRSADIQSLYDDILEVS